MIDFDGSYVFLKLVRSPGAGCNLSAFEPRQTPPFTALLSEQFQSSFGAILFDSFIVDRTFYADSEKHHVVEK